MSTKILNEKHSEWHENKQSPLKDETDSFFSCGQTKRGIFPSSSPTSSQQSDLSVPSAGIHS